MIVVDTCVLIAHFGVDHPHAERALNILDTEETLGVHPLSLAELLVHPARTGHEQVMLSQLVRLGIEQLTPTADEPVALARLRVDTGLKMPDCCVLAAAEFASADLATFDRRLAEVATGRGVTVRTGSD
ncbi:MULTISPECIES: type II toxin-antitoxin system VapC family toxin [Gordonia]|uniref:type II toxin-antitoxin system VapC family toxin n=1 Tax=Gordonia TaxID=2053 RepID=UPI0019C64C72|nr:MULTISPECIES: PIN domain-containing protein [Gordonia]MBD0021428.1 PIN domain-containing protein [Gordonia sp. (in: high G+C Gram-positive bacteria)]